MCHINGKNFPLTGKSRCLFSKHARVEQFREILHKTREQAADSLLSMGTCYHSQAPKPFIIVQWLCTTKMTYKKVSPLESVKKLHTIANNLSCCSLVWHKCCSKYIHVLQIFTLAATTRHFYLENTHTPAREIFQKKNKSLTNWSEFGKKLDYCSRLTYQPIHLRKSLKHLLVPRAAIHLLTVSKRSADF